MTNRRARLEAGRGNASPARPPNRLRSRLLLATAVVLSAASCRDFNVYDSQPTAGQAGSLRGGNTAGTSNSPDGPPVSGFGGDSSGGPNGYGGAGAPDAIPPFAGAGTESGAGAGAGSAGAAGAAGAGPARSVSPAELNGLALWLESSEGAFESSTDSRVSRWKDSSPHHNDATELDASLQPLLVADAIHGEAALRFDANPSNLVVFDDPSIQFGILPFAAAFVGEWHNTPRPTVVDEKVTYPGYGFIITKVIAQSPYTGLAISANAASPFSDVDAQPRLGVQLEIGSANLTSSSTNLNDAKFRLYLIERSALGVVEIRIDGKEQGRYEIPPALDLSAFGKNLYLGGYRGNQFAGSLAELVMVKGALTDAERMGLERYLTEKFGL